MDSRLRAELVERLGREAGFERVGIAVAQPIARQDYFQRWLDEGLAGEMAYLRRWRELRTDPRILLPGARSVIVVADNYRQEGANARGGEWERGTEGETERLRDGEKERGREGAVGRVAQYAWGRDYHRVLRKKLHRLVKALRAELDEPFDARVCVDTAPVIERELAAAAGIGWIGKNTLVLHQDLGSFFFLGEIITTLELTPSAPATDHCGSCTRCLDACPTAALTAPYQMDATRCISYLTIEHRGAIPEPLRPLMDDWVYGCDICQEVCPFNQDAPAATEPAYQLNECNTLTPRPLLSSLLAFSPDDYQQQLAGSAMKRATLPMLKRNAAIAARNAETRPSCPAG